MIPALISLPGAPWNVLPPGVHPATLAEVKEAYAYNQKRRALFEGLVKLAAELRGAGSRALYPDGSFVTGKPVPGDFDAIWDGVGVDRTRLHPVFFDFEGKREPQKAIYGGEFFPMNDYFFRLFQKEKDTGLRKGILIVDLISDPMLIAGTS